MKSSFDIRCSLTPPDSCMPMSDSTKHCSTWFIQLSRRCVQPDTKLLFILYTRCFYHSLLSFAKFLTLVLCSFSLYRLHSNSIFLKSKHRSLAENFTPDIYVWYKTFAVFIKSLECSLHHSSSLIKSSFFFLVSALSCLRTLVSIRCICASSTGIIRLKFKTPINVQHPVIYTM